MDSNTKSLAVAALLGLAATPAMAAASINLSIDGKNVGANAAPAPVKQNEVVTIEIDIRDGKIGKLIQLPHTDGVTQNGRGGLPQPHSDNTFFYVTPTKIGLVTIKAFDIRTTEGQTLHVGPIKLNVAK